ncbi:hypothetical protein DL96DRAFT_1455440 [Flagelloscypha sp. PMI_526]|nr:hypothetical protein DL96DRAFT_1455440 [Flagelloscypha sp. PMI_526]
MFYSRAQNLNPNHPRASTRTEPSRFAKNQVLNPSPVIRTERSSVIQLNSLVERLHQRVQRSLCPRHLQLHAAATSASRSRSTSVLPKDVASPVPPDSELQIESDEKDVDHASSDKLYCICQTPYDEDKVMIACDRCDEWYHTNCVDMQDLGVELVDQFYCPPCITKNPNLSLHTTYKKRCLFGSSHPAPETPEACHKAARGAFSKYCSEDCGVRHMRTKVETWENDGGKRNSLWKSVRTAEKPEGIVVRVSPPGTSPRMRDERESDDLEVAHHILGEIVQPTITQVERETRRLEEVLEHVVKLREDVTRGMAVLLWREQLLELARARAKRIGSCGWDQRLCFSDDEVAGFGEGVLESYEQLNHTQDGMDANATNQWWCLEDDCDRHDNWQNIRQRDINKEKEQKEAALAKLTTRERKIRAHIEDIN